MNRIRKQISRGLAVLLAVLAVSVNTTGSTALAAAAEVVFTDRVAPFNVSPGSTITVNVPVKAINGNIENPVIDLDRGDAPISVTSDFKLYREGYASDIINISQFEKTYVKFDITIADTALAKTYKTYLSFQYVYSHFDDMGNYVQTVEPCKMKTAIEFNVTGEKGAPAISVMDLKVDKKTLYPKDSFNITATVKNVGESAAKDVAIFVDGYGADGILPGYTTQKKNVGTMTAGQSISLRYPVSASEAATEGVKTLTVHVTYTNAAGEKKEETGSVFVTVKKKAEDNNTNANLLIKDVKQSPSVPMANGKLTLTYLLVNRGNTDAVSVKITPTNLTSANFSPSKAEPYKFIKMIKPGEEKKITMHFTVADKAAEGLNEIDVAITYKDKDGKDIDGGTSKLYVLNVKNPQDPVVGVPKLIVSSFDVGTEDLKAGKTFKFSFDIFNTHSSLSADNIKFTLSSEENVFSVASGSNSSYIKQIKPGETVHREIELRIKPDSVTKSYPLKIDFEYEYEGMQKLENEISTGLKVNETLNLQVLENSRPTISNIIVGTWDAPQTGVAGNMSFDFYNMGKSKLYNVMAKIDSTDFTPTQQTIFIGNVEAGAGSTYDVEITPNVENMDGKGVLVVTYEDSNGTSYDVKTDFSAFVNGAVIDTGGIDMGPLPENPTSQKKDILPIWAFVLIQVVIFFAGLLIVRKIIITVYKKKLRKTEEDI